VDRSIKGLKQLIVKHKPVNTKEERDNPTQYHTAAVLLLRRLRALIVVQGQDSHVQQQHTLRCSKSALSL
jgi:hypothetical protein